MHNAIQLAHLDTRREVVVAALGTTMSMEIEFVPLTVHTATATRTPTALNHARPPSAMTIARHRLVKMFVALGLRHVTICLIHIAFVESTKIVFDGMAAPIGIGKATTVALACATTLNIAEAFHLNALTLAALLAL